MTYRRLGATELGREAVARERLAQHGGLGHRQVHAIRKEGDSTRGCEKVAQGQGAWHLVCVGRPHVEDVVFLVELA